MRLEVSKNAKRNIIVGVLSKVILLLLPFLLRWIINTILGSIYLGLNSLFSSILQVLSLTELGLSSALVYNMYKPVAENDYSRINALLNLYKKAYRCVGICIIFFGIMFIPFLPIIIKGVYPKNINILLIYIIQLLNTAISYFLFAYKQSLLVAYQREDVNSIINLVTQLALQICQILLLLKTKNYYWYVLCMPVFTIISNLWIAYITKKMFPNLKSYGTIDKSTLKSIKKLVVGTFIQKACGITRNSLDSICISAFMGLSLTAIYNNYYLIFNGIVVILGIIQSSLVGGIGNHVALKNKEYNYDELKKLDYLYMVLTGICTVCLLCLYQPFMEIWMGVDMELSNYIVFTMVLYFYVLKLGDMRFIYSSVNGLWWEHRYRTIMETIANIVLNIILGKLFGIFGIVIATIISLLIFNFIWGAKIVFKLYFGIDKIKDYFLYHLYYAVVTFIISIIVYFITFQIHGDNNYITFFIKLIVCLCISTSLYFTIYHKTQLFKNSIKWILHR